MSHRPIVCLGLALGLSLVSAPAPAAEPAKLIVLGPPPAAAPLGHWRLGLAQISDPSINALFGTQGMSLGLDFPLGRGLALGLDSINMYRPGPAGSSLLSINPVQLRYRLGLPVAWPGFTPYVAAGGGLNMLGYFSGEAVPQAALGVAGSLGLGLSWHRGLTLELGYDAGKANAVGYSSWQVRLGSGLPELGRWFAPASAEPAPAPAPASVPGKVESVAGDRLRVRFARSPGLRPGDVVLVSYLDGYPVRVARAVLVSLEDGGLATARVLASTEPVKRGYDVHAW